MFRNALARLRETRLATRLDRWITGGMAALLFVLGFLAGRWTSLTDNAAPIVFQEAPGGASSAAAPEDLEALAAGTPSPRAPTAAARVADAATGAFVASANGEKYYAPDCPEVRRIKEENKIWFDSAAEAKDSGYEPSACLQKRR